MRHGLTFSQNTCTSMRSLLSKILSITLESLNEIGMKLRKYKQDNFNSNNLKWKWKKMYPWVLPNVGTGVREV